MVNIKSGTLLISDPFLKDPNFIRSVILICDHQDEGSVGFVLNRKYEHAIGELIHNLEGCNFPVYYGGPVQNSTIHFLHKRPDLIGGGFPVADGVFWGGDFDELMEMIHLDLIKENEVRFFIGYSGWGEGQLENELKEKSWITRKGDNNLIMHPFPDLLWQETLKDLGGEYAQMVNYPTDPQLN